MSCNNTTSVTTTTDNSTVVTIVTQGPQGPQGAQGVQGPSGSFDSGSLVVTASVSLNTITFTKGDNTTFPITVDTGSGGSSEWYDGGTFITSSKNIVVTGSITASGFLGDGSDLTNLQRPISTSIQVNMTASNDNAGFFFEVGGLVTCSIQTVASVTCDVGNEYEFFQTGSGNFLFETASGVTMYSKSGLKLNGEFAACTLKHIKTNTWVLIGDMTT